MRKEVAVDSEAAVELDIEMIVEPEAKAPREKTVMVSARVPSTLRNKVNDMLKKRGFTQTDLIVAAYSYFFETGELPENPSKAQWGEHRHDPLPDEVERFKDHMRSIVCQVRPECENWDYDRTKFEAMKDRYPEFLGNVEYKEGQ